MPTALADHILFDFFVLILNVPVNNISVIFGRVFCDEPVLSRGKSVFYLRNSHLALKFYANVFSKEQVVCISMNVNY